MVQFKISASLNAIFSYLSTPATGQEPEPVTLGKPTMLCLRSKDAFVITCVAKLMEVKVLYVQRDLRYEISSYWRFNV
jgi:hypothetical protein